MWTDFLYKLENKTVLITGATGLIGSKTVQMLLSQSVPGLKILALVRDPEKAKKILGAPTGLDWIKGDVCDLPAIPAPIDFIIHGASQTASSSFVNTPVSVAKTALLGTVNMLELSVRHKVDSFVYLSSMEIYGSPQTDEKISETHPTNIDTMLPRSCYPESKRMCESLCASYFAQYGVPAKVLRLTQTFGAGVSSDDQRVFSEFGRCAVEGRNIILHTKGDTKRSYLDTADAASAILTVLLNGQSGQAYNAANEVTYCSILEMAHLVADTVSENPISVIFDGNNDPRFGYAPTLCMNLETAKLRALGWEPTVNLENMYRRMLSHWKRVL